MDTLRGTNDKPTIAFLSDYIPRQCGIATFTANLCEAVAELCPPGSDVFTVAISDKPEGYPYPQRVRFEVRETVLSDYRLAAEYLNINQPSVVCVQHEYGIYGGTCGAHVLATLKRIRRPLVATLHTVLKTPTDQQHLVLQELSRLCERLVVMSDIAHEILHDVYGVPESKIVTIPHGIPDVPFIDPNYYKDQFGVEGRRVILTFGLLSPGKGIEYVIDALPEVVANHPDAIYIILGATHPHVKRESGEEYRNALARRAHELGVDDNVMFQNRFVDLEELCEFLGVADLYVTPYLSEAQITSGTLAYALGAGKATISTPYWYATELLADERGRLVPFRDSHAIAEQINDLLDNETARHAIRKRAYTYCRKMVWKRVAQDYLDLFAQAQESWIQRSQAAVVFADRAAADGQVRSDDLPEPDLRHLQAMTDDTGLLQHATYSTPNRTEGYCTDDNARALIVTLQHWSLFHNATILPLMQRYLAFLTHAMNEESGRFRNFMTYDRRFTEEIGSDDSHARALWALGEAVALAPHQSTIALATRLFTQAMRPIEDIQSPRAWAYAIVGIQEYLRRFGGDSEARRIRAHLAERLTNQFLANMSDDWPWCEEMLTYSNAKLPHALLMAGKWIPRGDMIDLGKRVLAWLLEVQTSPQGFLSLVGTSGWHHRNGPRAQFDQQPVEACALVDACIEAYHITRDPFWTEQARKAFNWFLGDNDLRRPLYDFTTGGCRDGLHPDRVNENQGAESTLAWLLSLLSMHELQMELTIGQLPPEKNLERPLSRPIKPTAAIVAAQQR
ncbi:MAG: glycosyltransferase family 4 protein [Planctomycetaceae bacterium]|nr:glycosyltransferase family 4 protein [Planctomycetaceae bacterium]